MKKTYTKKQITEAIAYWENQLKMLNESARSGKMTVNDLAESVFQHHQDFRDAFVAISMPNGDMYYASDANVLSSFGGVYCIECSKKQLKN